MTKKNDAFISESGTDDGAVSMGHNRLINFLLNTPFPLSKDYELRLFGFGWKNNAPEEVYLIPSKAIYEYKDTGEIKFLNDIDEARKKEKFKIYQVVLDKGKGRHYIQYKSYQCQ